MAEPGRIAASVERVRERIASAARRAGRDPEEVRLVAVTKTVPAEIVREAVAAGVTDLGENRVQEGLAKAEALAGTIPPVRWHLIGHLQTNKAARAAGLFRLIHSVDSPRVAEALAAAVARSAERAGAAGADPPAGPLEVLLEVNVAGEASKFGVAPEQVADLARAVARLEGVALRGLMTVAPFAPDPETVRPVFRRLAGLAREIEALRLPGVEMRHLSMGMSQDFEVAVSEGASLVRIGTAIFGPRGG